MNKFAKKLRTFGVAATSLALLFAVNAFVAEGRMSSENYQIEFDSINVGGTRSTSESYILEDTIGEIGTGYSDSESYNLHAGYQQMHESFIAVSVPASAELQPDMAQPGDSAQVVVEVVVTTDNPAGYTLNTNADTSPALQSATSEFQDYQVDQAGIPDFEWSIDQESTFFGFTPEGIDVVQKFLDDGANCDTGSQNTQERCWYFFSQSNEAIAQSSSSNQPDGTSTDVRMQAQIGENTIQEMGSYSANITFTAIPN